MTSLKQMLTPADLDAVLAESSREPVLILKHSTACPISARAKREWDAFVESPEAGRVALAWVRVIEERHISLALSERVGVEHQSPQVLLVKDGKALWHDSHSGITQAALKAAVARAPD